MNKRILRFLIFSMTILIASFSFQIAHAEMFIKNEKQTLSLIDIDDNIASTFAYLENEKEDGNFLEVEYKRMAEEKRKIEEEKRKAEEARIKAEEEVKKKAEEEKRKVEEAKRKAEEEAKRKAEAAKRKKAVSTSSSDLDMLARIIQAEAGGEPYQGKVAVGAVVLNRVADSRFPNSVKGVVFQPKQFSPISDGRYYSVKVSTDSYNAAKEALNGADPTSNATYFYAPTMTLQRWHETLKHTTTIGNHKFFKP